MTEKLIPCLVLTLPLCIVGMLGDLFASTIKRSVGLKDYGSLIPGHGGVLDRVDSILLISPIYLILISLGVL
jgi:phosphatidate cytidylyltransferase